VDTSLAPSRVNVSSRQSSPPGVDEASIQQLLDGVSAVDPNGLSGGGGFGLVHGAFDAVGHELHSRVGSRPSGGDVVGKYECWSPSLISVPAMGDVESASTGQRRHQFRTRDREGARRSARTP
jgi:hypothetical protein